jgi:creatinine amidohydrolase
VIKPYILAQSNWKTLKDAQIDLAILPWGATEAHNYHLPYSTDNIEGEHIAFESARIAWEKGAKVIVLPNIPFGVNTGQSDIKLTLNINPSTQMALLDNIIATLNRQGIYKLLILNSHGGNDFKPLLRELGAKYPNMFLSTANWFQSVNNADFFENAGDHADEMETSLMLHIAPELVLPLNEAGDGKAKKNKIAAFSKGWVWTERPWSKVTADTGIGNPKAATKEKGEKYFKAVTEKIANLFVELANADTKKLYE